MKALTRLGSVIALAVALTLALASCGGGGSDADAEITAALAANWEADDDFPDGFDVECLASGFIKGIGGADGAAEYDVNKDNIGDGTFEDNPLNEDDALGAAEGMLDCDDFKEVFVAEISGAEDEDADCLANELTDEPLTALLASGFMGDNSSVLEDQFENIFEEEFAAGLVSCEIGQ